MRSLLRCFDFSASVKSSASTLGNAINDLGLEAAGDSAIRHISGVDNFGQSKHRLWLKPSQVQYSQL